MQLRLNFKTCSEKWILLLIKKLGCYDIEKNDKLISKKNIDYIELNLHQYVPLTSFFKLVQVPSLCVITQLLLSSVQLQLTVLCLHI